MEWDKRLECGIPIIDHEHRELFELLDRLIRESDPSGVRETLAFLREYVVKHFAHEQVMHRNSRYPKAEEHKALHIDFVHTFLALRDEYNETGDDPAMLQKLIDILSDWLKKHIMGEDREFSIYYKNVKSEGKISVREFR